MMGLRNECWFGWDVVGARVTGAVNTLWVVVVYASKSSMMTVRVVDVLTAPLLLLLLILLRLLLASWLMSDTIGLLDEASGQHTPGTNKLWKQMDFRKLSSCRSKAGQLPRSRHWPRPPSGVVHGRTDADEELDSVLVSKLLLIFSAVAGAGAACPTVGNRWLNVNLPMLKRVWPRPLPSRLPLLPTE